jgi:MFS family permease
MSSALGGVADRFSRRNLIVSLELLRAAILLATPWLLHVWLWLIIPVLFVLASINAIVQPARQAAIPSLVPPGQVGKANAIVVTTGMLAGAAGFGLAGGILLVFQTPMVLFLADAMTFVLAAAVVMSIPSLGGGGRQTAVSGALRRTWSIVATRPHLVIGVLAAFLIPISFPALLTLAYRYSVQGGQTYSVLELVLSMGILFGSIAVGRFGSIGSMRTVGAGLLLTGVFSIAIALSHSLVLIAVALFVASIGNPIYAIANQTALIEAADVSNRGAVMATRFGLVQTASILGTAVGGLITKIYDPHAAYGVLGVGLVLLAMYALAAGRSTVNPLHGAAYEEAQAKAMAAQMQAK